jgi:inner membrane protein
MNSLTKNSVSPTILDVSQSEDNALLMGALILFAVLAVVMMLTRRMDWYRLHEASNTI